MHQVEMNQLIERIKDMIGILETNVNKESYNFAYINICFIEQDVCKLRSSIYADFVDE